MDRYSLAKIPFIALLGTTTALATPTFTGNVPEDFAIDGAFSILDPGGLDVGLPATFPSGTISGNDLADIQLFYDAPTDTLIVGFNAYVIAGDVDGDGDGGSTGSDLASVGGLDIADFGGSESFALMLDIDEDGHMDIIAGVSGHTDTTGFSVSLFTGSIFTPGFAFGEPLPDHTGSLFSSPSASEPDLEFTITNFSTLPVSSGYDSASTYFQVIGFVGSFSDAGIGEDSVPGVSSAARVNFDNIPTNPTPTPPQDTPSPTSTSNTPTPSTSTQSETATSAPTASMSQTPADETTPSDTHTLSATPTETGPEGDPHGCNQGQTTAAPWGAFMLLLAFGIARRPSTRRKINE